MMYFTRYTMYDGITILVKYLSTYKKVLYAKVCKRSQRTTRHKCSLIIELIRPTKTPVLNENCLSLHIITNAFKDSMENHFITVITHNYFHTCKIQIYAVTKYLSIHLPKFSISHCQIVSDHAVTVSCIFAFSSNFGSTICPWNSRSSLVRRGNDNSKSKTL